MSKIAQNCEKPCCFFANMCFHAGVCDSNHKKCMQKSSTIPSRRTGELLLLGKLVCEYLNLKRSESMKKSFDRAILLTTSLVSNRLPQACILQSALTSVRSVECGLFA